jgi:serine/threonine protein kinase
VSPDAGSDTWGLDSAVPPEQAFRPRAHLEIGAVVDGEYEILGTLGQGAYAHVYRAREQRIKREVALKVLKGRRSREDLERFRREGALSAGLRHPGIVRVHGAGNLNGSPYLVFERIEGCTLDEVLFLRPRAERLRLLVDVARAVGHAHSKGVLHRDLKPGNVLVDERGEVRVADFGCGRSAEAERLTRTGELIGTPHYIAPEQLRPKALGSPGPAADVWALGVMLYQALTERFPLQATTYPQLLAALATETPVPPRSLDRSIPRRLEAVCLKALRRKPAQRQPNAEVFADELQAVLASGLAPGTGWRWLLALLVVGGVLLAALLATR